MKDPQVYLEQAGLKSLGFDPGALDGVKGPKTIAARQAYDVTLGSGSSHAVMASSFADPADVAAFKKCKACGGSDQECFAVGDNGIGKWGDDTTTDEPSCALPPEDWQRIPNPRGAKVLVKSGDKEVLCKLLDTMPHVANIKNGAGIDLNPAAIKALGHSPPAMFAASWQWA